VNNAIMKDVGPLPRGSTPLCVDLDGTLIRTDLLHESIVILLKRNPLIILALVLWLFKGKAGFKDEVSKRVMIDPSILPYNQRVLNWVRGERNRGRYIVLATASNHRLAESVASYLDCFDEIVASDADGNISDREKCAALVSKFGKRRFDYAGNSSKDVVVWEQCDQAIVVEATKSVPPQLEMENGVHPLI
jgi:phosphoserine phosphatase